MNISASRLLLWNLKQFLYRNCRSKENDKRFLSLFAGATCDEAESSYELVLVHIPVNADDLLVRSERDAYILAFGIIALHFSYRLTSSVA